MAVHRQNARTDWRTRATPRRPRITTLARAFRGLRRSAEPAFRAPPQARHRVASVDRTAGSEPSVEEESDGTGIVAGAEA